MDGSGPCEKVILEDSDRSCLLPQRRAFQEACSCPFRSSLRLEEPRLKVQNAVRCQAKVHRVCLYHLKIPLRLAGSVCDHSLEALRAVAKMIAAEHVDSSMKQKSLPNTLASVPQDLADSLSEPAPSSARSLQV